MQKEFEKNIYRQKYIDYLKVLACILIINSHCRNIYPYYFLAVGGGFGNSIFFILSGFCLINIKYPFREWYKKRINRIVPAVIGAGIFGLVLTNGHPDFSENTIMSIGKFYVDRYWFVFAILLYYIVYFIIFKVIDRKYIKYCLLVYLFIYILLYICMVDKSQFSVELEGFSLFKVYFYLGILLLGGYIRIALEKYKTNFNKKTICLISFLFIFSIIIWGMVYMLIMVWGKCLYFQFLIHLCVGIFSVTLLLLGSNFRTIEIRNRHINQVCMCVAESTLEIYLIQVTIQKNMEQLSFPLSLIGFISISLVGGVLYHKIIRRVEKFK